MNISNNPEDRQPPLAGETITGGETITEEIDAAGMAWDESIHSGKPTDTPKARNKDGRFKMRKGKKAEYYFDSIYNKPVIATMMLLFYPVYILWIILYFNVLTEDGIISSKWF